jgi:hypothetical protein
VDLATPSPSTGGTTSSDSLLGVPLRAGLGTADHGSTSPNAALGAGIDAARGSNDGLAEVEDDMKAEEARLPPIRLGALNMAAGCR